MAVDDSAPAVVVVETDVGVVGVIDERKAAQERTLAQIVRHPLGAAVGEEDQDRAAEQRGVLLFIEERRAWGSGEVKVAERRNVAQGKGRGAENGECGEIPGRSSNGDVGDARLAGTGNDVLGKHRKRGRRGTPAC